LKKKAIEPVLIREEIALTPPARRDAPGLFDMAAARYGLESFDLDAFRCEALASARGNPR
jgi:hypothetical protein